MGIYVVHGSEFRDEFSGTDFSNALDSRHVVGCVSAYCEDLHHLLRCVYAVFFADLDGVYDLRLASGFSRFILQDIRRYELAVVLVRGDHIHCEAFLLGALGH